jgi:hypothetical protein
MTLTRKKARVPLIKNLSHVTLAAMETSARRPTLGRRIALEMYSARPLTWLGPLAATLCGALAASGLVISGETLLRVAIAVILTDPILGAWRTAWVNTDWRRPMRGWEAAPTRAWMLVPYARLGSPAARFSQWLSSRARFWREAVVPHVGQAISAIVVSALIALSVALVLGTTTFLLTIVALVLAPLESELGTDGAGRWARALAEIGMAWLIGDAAISLVIPPLDSAVLALGFAISYRGLLSVATRPRLGLGILNVSQVLLIAFLYVRGSILSATLLALAMGAIALWQTLVRAGRDDLKTFLGRVQWFVLLGMFIAALGIPH